MTYESQVSKLTTSMRRSDDQPWPLVRQFLSSQGYDSSQIVVGDFFNDDVDLYAAYLLAEDGRVLRLDVQYLLRHPLDGPVELVGTKVWGWEEVPPSDRHWRTDPMLAAGRQLLQDEMSNDSQGDMG